MPSSSNITPALVERRTQSSEPVSTPAIQQKLALLPELRRRQLLEQERVLRQKSQPKSYLAETTVQSFDQLAEPDLSTSHTNETVKKTTTTRYTISSGAPGALIATDYPRAEPAITTSDSQPVKMTSFANTGPNLDIDVTDFKIHRGETAVMRAPIIGDDLKSRLEGLRQFKEWSERIHRGLEEETRLATKVIRQACATPTKTVLTVEKYSPEGAAEKACLTDGGRNGRRNNEFRIVETAIVAPTPFCSPQVTPLPCTTVKNDPRDISGPPPSFDLPGKLPSELITYARPRAHSKTIVISPETPNAQLVPASSTIARTESTHQVPRRSHSKSRSHPPISFPSDFYERFPTAENLARPKNPQSSQSRTRLGSGVSPEATPSIPAVEDVSADEIEPLAPSHDTAGQLEFHATIHYFTECPHSSPPANRPLNASGQPRPDPNFLPTKSQSIRSIIPGACFNCDLANRRAKEDEIICSCTVRLTEVADNLKEALNEIELGDSDDEDIGAIHDKHSARLLTTSRFAEDKHDLDIETDGIVDLPPLSDDPDVGIVPQNGLLRTAERVMYTTRLVQRIRDLEGRIQRVRVEQEGQIKKVWAGFTPRWGPGTLGVQRCGRALSMKPADEVSSESLGLERCITIPATSAGIDAVQAGCVESAGHGCDNVRPGREGSCTGTQSVSRSRSRASSRSCSRSRNCTPDTPDTVNSVVSARDLPGSRTPGEGKMKIGWIRDGKG